MSSLLNDCEAFSTACVGSGIAFGLSALFTFGTPFAGEHISLSVISFTVAALTRLVLRLDEKAQKKKGPFDANQNGPNKKNICNCIIADYGENVKGGSR